MDNKVPIIKIAIAALSIIYFNYKKILKISIIPAIFILPFILNMSYLIEEIRGQDMKNISLSNEFLIYSISFIYGYTILNISLYRMIVLGEKQIFKYSIAPPILTIKFAALMMLIYIFITIPSFTGLQIFEALFFILASGTMLHLVTISINQEKKMKLVLFDRVAIAILQFIIPMLLLGLALYIHNIIFIIIKLFLIYWTAIALALVFNYIKERSSKQEI